MQTYTPPMRQREAPEAPSFAHACGKGFLAAHPCLCLAFALTVCVLGARLAAAEPVNQTNAAAERLVMATSSGSVQPIDWRHRIEASELAQSGKGVWTSPIVKAALPFNELI